MKSSIASSKVINYCCFFLVLLIESADQKKDVVMHNYYKNKKVLVTGGAGFIGSHLAESLVNFGAQVTILDDFSSGTDENIFAFSDKISLIKGSIVDAKICNAACKNQEIIFHCAALVSVPQSIEHPQQCYERNIQGTFNMLEAARLNNVKCFIFSSSAAVYGAYDVPCREDMLCNPLSPYGFSKLIGELLCQQYSFTYNLKTACLRYFNVYGPRQQATNPYSGVIAKLRHNMTHNLPITIFGDGSQQRDFISVFEVVKANLMIATLPDDLLKGQAINIATGKSINLLELIDRLKKEYPDYQLPLLHGQPREGDIRYSIADCSLYKKLQTHSLLR